MGRELWLYFSFDQNRVDQLLSQLEKNESDHAKPCSLPKELFQESIAGLQDIIQSYQKIKQDWNEEQELLWDDFKSSYTLERIFYDLHISPSDQKEKDFNQQKIEKLDQQMAAVIPLAVKFHDLSSHILPPEPNCKLASEIGIGLLMDLADFSSSYLSWLILKKGWEEGFVTIENSLRVLDVFCRIDPKISYSLKPLVQRRLLEKALLLLKFSINEEIPVPALQRFKNSMFVMLKKHPTYSDLILQEIGKLSRDYQYYLKNIDDFSQKMRALNKKLKKLNQRVEEFSLGTRELTGEAIEKSKELKTFNQRVAKLSQNTKGLSKEARDKLENLSEIRVDEKPLKHEADRLNKHLEEIVLFKFTWKDQILLKLFPKVFLTQIYQKRIREQFGFWEIFSDPHQSIEWTSFSGAGGLPYKEYLREEIYLRGIYIALAHHLYYRTQGHYPSELSQLISEDENFSLIEDPYNPGKPFIYERQANGYLLYSFGPNQANDQGDEFKDIVLIFTKSKF